MKFSFKDVLIVASVTIGLLAGIPNSKAASYTVSSNNVAPGIYTYVPAAVLGAGTITSVQVVNTNSNTYDAIYLFDAPTNQTTYTIGAYTNVTRSLISVSNVYTNVFGTVTTNTPYSAITNTLSSVPSSVNNYPVLLTTTVGTNNTTYTFSGTLPFYRGLVISNSAICNITFTYSR